MLEQSSSPLRSTREEMVDECLVLCPVDLTLHPPPTCFSCPLIVDLHTPSVVVLHGDDGVPDERRGLGENGGPDGGSWVGFWHGLLSYFVERSRSPLDPFLLVVGLL